LGQGLLVTVTASDGTGGADGKAFKVFVAD
jgi:hypothetical protein